MILKKMPTLFSSESEGICTKDILCQILNSNSNGRWFAVITHFKLIRKPLGKLGRVSGDVIHSTTSWMQWKEASANRDVAVVGWQKSHKRSFYPHVREILAFDLPLVVHTLEKIPCCTLGTYWHTCTVLWTVPTTTVWHCWDHHFNLQ